MTVPPSETPAHAKAASAEERRMLERTWADPPGLWGWLVTVNHKRVASRYIASALVFFALGGIEAALMRIQLARPENRFIGPDLYNQLFTTHGTTMMFLFAVPIMEAVGLYVVPLMIGTRNVCFPRLNAYGYWTYVIGGLLIYSGLILNTGPDTGWFSYVPLAGPEFSPGKRVDVWAQMVTFTEISAIVSAVEIIVTAFKQRAPGMSLNRVPLFVWAMVIASFMVLFAMPVVATGSMFLAMDRLVGTHFFNPSEGGDVLLWQHIYWFFGHPEVYIIFIPSLGIVSSIVATFTGRPIVGYTAAVFALITTAFLSFGLWVHHMFATPLPQLGQAFFTASSAMIAVPTGVMIFCWIATIWAGRPRWHTPMLFATGFIVLFTIGGLSGLFVAAVPTDLQLTDTYFVPGHIHYVLIGGMVFPFFGGAHYWFPKLTGRMLSDRAGKLSFGLLFAGVNVTFFPFFVLAFLGMPRRVYTYLPETGWAGWSLVSSFGVVLLTLGLLVFIANVIWALRQRPDAPADPWGGETLEWAIASPPPAYNFAHIPVVGSRSALWAAGPRLPVATGLNPWKRELLLTTVVDAIPDARHEQPGPTIAPLLLGIATGITFISGIFTPWAFVGGPALGFLALLWWAWPRGNDGGSEIVELPR